MKASAYKVYIANDNELTEPAQPNKYAIFVKRKAIGPNSGQTTLVERFSATLDGALAVLYEETTLVKNEMIWYYCITESPDKIILEYQYMKED